MSKATTKLSISGTARAFDGKVDIIDRRTGAWHASVFMVRRKMVRCVNCVISNV